jgi:hypothetical protein
LPDIFLRETIQTVGSYVIEEPFYPLPAGTTPILRGIDPTGLPALLGYNGTTPKATAKTPLLSPRGDPVLAQWQYGLGRAVAWTSDLKAQWASDWVAWAQFNQFAAQLVGWTLPDPSEESLRVAIDLDGADATFQVDATDEAGRPRDLLDTEVRLVGPDLDTKRLTLEQTAAGRYEGRTSVPKPGTYLVHAVQRDDEGDPVAQQTTGLVVPYSPEYRRTGGGEALLGELARATGGEAALADPAEAFAPMAEPVSRARPLWPALLLMAALLFPVDVAVRRLRLTGADWQRLLDWARGRLPRRARRTERAEPAVLGELFEARDRARGRVRRGRAPDDAQQTSGKRSPAPGPGEATPSQPPEPSRDEEESASDEKDTLARLREARERARRRH